MVGTTKRRTTRRLAFCQVALALGIALWGCKSGEDVEPSAEDATGEVAVEGEADTKEVPDKIEGLTIKEKAAAFVIPAPSEIVVLLQEADPEGELLASVGNELPSYDGLPNWKAALALGIANADLLLTVPEAPDEDIVARLDNIAAGMAALGSTQDQIDSLVDLRGKVAGGAIEREALVRQLDDLRIGMLAQGKEQYGERQVALIAVGGWARAVNLFARGAEKTSTIPAGADVLKLRIVIDTLIADVGTDEEVQPVVVALQKILPVASSTTRADAPPTAEEIQILLGATGEILALARAS